MMTRGTGIVGYNVQAAVDTQHHLLVAHEVTNVGSDRDQLSSMAKQAREAIASETLSVVADRGYFKSEQILACHDAGITAYVPKPMTSGAKADGRFNNAAWRTPTIIAASTVATASVVAEGIYDWVVIGKAAWDATSSGDCDCGKQ
jgi:hypothetical protein